MKIEQIDLFYLSMPTVLDIGDGSQDALLVRVRAENLVGWGECEASPLVSLANWVCPPSHSACRNVREQIVGQRIESPVDIARLGNLVRAKGLDIAQTHHTWSGVEIALWDLLGKRLDEPVFRLLGFDRCEPKTPYASQLFGATPHETYVKAKTCASHGFHAVKFGWANYGRTKADDDADQVAAARDGLGPDGMLMIDAGTVWGEDVGMARERLPALEEHNVTWFEEPFVGEALSAYAELASDCDRVRLAGGEGATTFHAARNLIDHGKIGFVQIDTGRVGGIMPAKQISDYACQKGIIFVNHTFTTHLALAASLVPYAGVSSASICEYPVEASDLASRLTSNRLDVKDGVVTLNDKPGLGIDVDEAVVEEFLVDVQIRVRDKTLYITPNL